MSRIHATLADRRPEGRIERQSCFTLVRVELLRRKAFAEFAALSAARAASIVAPAPVDASGGKSRQRKLRSHRASRSSLNPAWRGLSSDSISS